MFGDAAEPVDLDLEVVVEVLEGAGLPCGEAEDGGSAEASVCDEEGACLGGAFAGCLDGGLLDGDAGEAVGAFVSEVEGKE